MIYSYLNCTIIKNILGEGLSCLNKDIFYIGGIGDVLLETEYHKDKLTTVQYLDKFKILEEEENGLFFVGEITKDTILEGMFENDFGNMAIDQEVADSKKPPHFTVNYLALKPNPSLNFWDNDILEEMKIWYND